MAQRGMVVGVILEVPPALVSRGRRLSAEGKLAERGSRDERRRAGQQLSPR
jgi:hypothetical protein